MSAPRLEAGLLVLAGGQSRRMGTPKSLLPANPDGTGTLIEALVDRLAPSFAELLVAGPPDLVPAALHSYLVADLHRDAGPLAGLEAGLAATRHQVVFAAATDMPRLEASVARRLVEASDGHDAAVPRLERRIEPLAAAYRVSSSAGIAAALGARRLAIQEVLAELDVLYLDGLEAGIFENLNTPGDHCRFLDALRQKR